MALDSRSLRWALVAAVAVLGACMPATDRDRYDVGDSGTATFSNELRSTTLYLGGCGHYEYEKRVGGGWVSQGPDYLCVWEGTAQPVPPGAVVTDALHTREPGIWRLRYAVGIGCSDTAPLSECALVEEIVSNEYTVFGGGCVVTGCSGQVCAEHPVGTTCEFLPYYACYSEARCGHFGPADECAWEPTDELAACLAASGAPNLSPR